METAPSQETLQRLVQTIAPQSRLIRAWPLAGGMSAGMTALEIKAPGGARRKVILRQPGEANLRQNPRAAEDEYHLLRGLHSQGLAVAEPLYLAAPGEVFSTACLVMAYVEGQVDFAPAAVDDYARQLAAELARIHRVPCSPPECPALPPGIEIFASLVTQRPARMNDALDEGRIRAALAAVWPILQRGGANNVTSNAPGNAPGKATSSATSSATSNASGIATSNASGIATSNASGIATLLHGDYWPGNVLWREGRLAAVIDWEDAALGDPLIDLAIARLDLLWIVGREAMEAFTRHYLALSALDSALLPTWDLCAALRLLRMAGGDLAGWAAFFHPYGREDITAETIRAHFRFFTAQALDRLASLK